MIAILSSLIPIKNGGIVMLNLTLEIIYLVVSNSSIVNKITTLMAKIPVCIILITRVLVYMSVAIHVTVKLTPSLV